ncbi:hypothetical protein IAR55_001612 [Kwoniella newhampshirensis]|uniref:Uncharacterized protein n=1 Tax=Kwoniella newhampshirensis TaxID=1651941 RepID=A0AAW0Z2M1_9TREE
MNDLQYQARKARALELQREKEAELKKELAAKAAREKQKAKEDEERRRRLEAASKEARRLELMRANEELNKKAAVGKNGDANGKGVETDYDPFAEDAKPVGVPIAHKATNAKPTAKNISSGVARPTRAAPRTTSSKPAVFRSSSGLITEEKGSPPPLSRKEKAARAFAQQAKKSAGDSLFSVRALVEARESSGASGPSSARISVAGPSKSQSSNVSTNITVHGIGMPTGLKRDKSSLVLGGVGGKGKGSTRQQIQRKGAEEGLRKLCPDRSTRDRRTIEEIARDIKAKKDGIGSSFQIQSREDGRMISPAKGSRPLGVTNGAVSMAKSSSLPSTSAKVPLPNRDDPRLTPSSARRRRRSSSSSSSSSSTSSKSSLPPAKKRYRSPPVRLTEHSSAAAVSAEIQALFRRPGRPPPPPHRRGYGYDDDDISDGSSDMEAGLSDVELEERRAARIARKEDEQAEREERERKARKEALKKQKGRA